MYNPGVEVFLSIMKTRNISRSAEQLNLSQSTVSKRLKDLERELNVVLFERGKGNKSINLTLAGENFIELAERWQSLWRETQHLQSSVNSLSLSIGTLDSMNYAVFPELFRKLSLHRPKINLKVVTSHSYELYQLIEQGQVDVAFTLLRREHPNIIVEKSFEEQMVGIRMGISSQDDIRLVHPQELDSNDELFVYWGTNYQIWHDQWWNPSCPGRIKLDTSQLILSFFNSEKQWAIVPLSVAKAAQKKGKYQIFGFSEAPPNRICYKITHKYSKAATQESLKILDKYLQKIYQSPESLYFK